MNKWNQICYNFWTSLHDWHVQHYNDTTLYFAGVHTQVPEWRDGVGSQMQWGQQEALCLRVLWPLQDWVRLRPGEAHAHSHRGQVLSLRDVWLSDCVEEEPEGAHAETFRPQTLHLRLLRLQHGRQAQPASAQTEARQGGRVWLLRLRADLQLLPFTAPPQRHSQQHREAVQVLYVWLQGQVQVGAASAWGAAQPHAKVSVRGVRTDVFPP